ncbi:MAG: SMC-Scp complex subunit ScpB [Parcubacteria group bacterium]|nr:SMC-Scp complex subunit ScpB [Parcubacteria group bacterium]
MTIEKNCDKFQKDRAMVESLIFVSGGDCPMQKISDAAMISIDRVREIVCFLQKECEDQCRGLRLMIHDENVSMVTDPECAETVRKFLKRKTEQELSRAQLETLAIIAYRKNITKPSLEIMRGVNCSQVLAHLLIAGYIVESEDAKTQIKSYDITVEFLKYLGVMKREDLPNFETLSKKTIPYDAKSHE